MVDEVMVRDGEVGGVSRERTGSALGSPGDRILIKDIDQRMTARLVISLLSLFLASKKFFLNILDSGLDPFASVLR